jgi:hypothetical protein
MHLLFVQLRRKGEMREKYLYLGVGFSEKQKWRERKLITRLRLCASQVYKKDGRKLRRKHKSHRYESSVTKKKAKNKDDKGEKRWG